MGRIYRRIRNMYQVYKISMMLLPPDPPTNSRLRRSFSSPTLGWKYAPPSLNVWEPPLLLRQCSTSRTVLESFLKLFWADHALEKHVHPFSPQIAACEGNKQIGQSWQLGGIACQQFRNIWFMIRIITNPAYFYRPWFTTLFWPVL